MRRTFVIAFSLLLPFTAGCKTDASLSPGTDSPSFAPASNENKSVFVIDETSTVTCPGSGLVLTRHDEGWVQARTFGEGNKNVALDVFHNSITFTDPEGGTFVFRDVGPDHYYMDEQGNLIIAITGRSTGSGVIGHVVINLTTAETLLVAGNEFGLVNDLACEALA